MMKRLLLILCLFIPSIASGDIVSRAVVFGDSFSVHNSHWPSYTQSADFVDRFAFGGRWLAQIANEFESELGSVTEPYDGIVVMAGINDTFNERTVEQLQSSVNTIIGLTPPDKTLIFATLPPARGRSSFTDFNQGVSDSFNDWLFTVEGIQVFDLNAVLDSNGDDVIDAQWDRDGLHPTNGSNGGHGHIARSFDHFNTVPEPSFVPALIVIGFLVRRMSR